MPIFPRIYLNCKDSFPDGGGRDGEGAGEPFPFLPYPFPLNPPYLCPNIPPDGMGMGKGGGSRIIGHYFLPHAPYPFPPSYHTPMDLPIFSFYSGAWEAGRYTVGIRAISVISW